MKFRYARHTSNLKAITDFYTKIIGLKKLGSFENHSNYNGIFIGLPDLDWHLEFTESTEVARHTPDEDDLIVLYLKSAKEMEKISRTAKQYGIEFVKSKNPYWQTNGKELKDPDGYGVMLTISQK